MVLVMFEDSVKFIIKFIMFMDEMVLYMYYCYLLYYEDDGMMGLFLVYDLFVGIGEMEILFFDVFLNLLLDVWMIIGNWDDKGVLIEFVDV